MEGTVRVAVRCDGGSASGTDRATVETTSPGDCTVTALGASRERRVAVVHGVRMADYACFQGAGQDCALVPP
jgi:hypothetical protein